MSTYRGILRVKQKVYEREEESHAHFMDKADIEQIEAFEYRDHLIPRKENAFLFRQNRQIWQLSLLSSVLSG